MNEPSAYTYCVLRYVHDTTTGEFVNVGVALHAPRHRYASAICRNTYGRLSRTFPGLSGDHFKGLMRYIQARFEQLGDQMGNELALEPAASVLELAQRVLRPDDSSLQWSPMGAGRTDDPGATLEQLFERLVMKYDEPVARARRTEVDVWRAFRRKLEERHLAHHLQPRKIAVKDDQIEFDYTIQNGILHCLEPVSFDLGSPESIRDKAHRWLGRMASIAESPERFRLYFLVGAPQEDDLHDVYESALRILGKSTVEKRILREDQADRLCEALTEAVAEHDTAIVAEPGPFDS